MTIISINTQRLDWPNVTTVELPDPPTLSTLHAQRPDLFENAKVLKVQNADERWVDVQPDDVLSSSRQYWLVSQLSEEALANASNTCTSCGALVADVSALRYHSGTLTPQEWGYGIYSWEWTCCHRIVSNTAVNARDASTGCSIGLCSACRDDAPYQAATTRNEQALADIFG